MFKVNICSRYPLPLQNGMQCKIIQGFGNTICKRLEDKLKEHRLKQSNSLEIPVSPVLLPQGQVPRASPTKSNSPSSSKSQEDRDLELALELSQQEFVPRAFPKKSNSLSSQEDKDLELALELSQQEASQEQYLPRRTNSEEDDYQFALQLSQQEDDYPPEGAADDSQEELDRQFALKLQEEFNKEAAPPVVRPPSPPRAPFTFDNEGLEAGTDYVNDNDLPDLPDLPDISLSAPPTTTSVIRSKNSATAGSSKQKRVSRPRVTHDISVLSDEEDDNPLSHAMEGLLNNNPSKGKGKSSTRSKYPQLSSSLQRD